MRYTNEFKLNCVNMYYKGEYPDTPEGISKWRFHKTIRQWVRKFEAGGIDALIHKQTNYQWTTEERYALVVRVIAGDSYSAVAISAGIAPAQLYKWVQKYKTKGYNGLNFKKGRPTNNSSMKNKNNPSPLSEAEREELIRLRAENEYIKAENEVIKKRIALRQEKWVAQLKAKKQQSSKISEKKDTN